MMITHPPCLLLHASSDSDEEDSEGVSLRLFKLKHDALPPSDSDDEDSDASGSDDSGWSDLEDFIVCKPDRDYSRLFRSEGGQVTLES